MKRLISLLDCLCLILAVYATGWAQKPELVVQMGHTYGVNSIAFSPDGKVLASGSGDKTVKLWDVAVGQEIRTFLGHISSVSSVAFSPDGRTLASGSWDKTIKLWDLESGIELRTLKGHANGIYSVVFLNGGKMLASGSSDNTIKLWDIQTGREVMTLKGHTYTVHSLASSSDGRTLASGSFDGTLKLWDVQTGKELKTFKGHIGMVLTVAYSPDGRMLASGGGGADDSVKLWDIASGQELRAFKWDIYSITSVAFSPDGKTLAASTSSIKFWDVATGQELKVLKGNTYEAGGLTTIVFSPDGKTLASGAVGSEPILWDIALGQEAGRLKKYSDDLEAAGFSPDGKTIAFGNRYKDIKLWDVTQGLKSLRGSGNSFVFSPNSKILASDSSDGTITLWEVATGNKLKTLKGRTDIVFSMAFSPDGKMLASGSMDNTIKLWDIQTGKELRTLKGHTYWVTSVAFSPDGKTLASRSGDQTIKLWDTASGRELKSLLRNAPNTESEVSTVVPALYQISKYESSYDPVSPDGTFQLKKGLNGRFDLFELKTDRMLASLISIEENQYSYEGRGWIVITPDGLFDGSPSAWNKINWRFNNNTFNYAPVEAFFSDFYYPGLLADIFSGKRPKASSDISQKDRRQPQLKLTLANAQANQALTARNLTLKVEVAQAPAGARDVRLFRNGSLVKVWHGDVLKRQRSVTLRATIPIVAGENRLIAYAFNQDNIKSTDATLIVNGTESLKRQGIAYILAVGVNSYSNPQYNLKYAVADAQAFAAEVKRQQEKLKNYSQIEIISLSDNNATKLNIIQEFVKLAGRVQPEDAVLVYFAGHGTAQQNRFYLIPHDLGYSGERTKLDEAGLRAILAHSISDRELEQAFEKIDAGQLLLVIDACNSGQALEANEKRRGPMNSKGLAQLAYEKGMYIMTAAQSYQAAKEAARLGHGYLTYALIVEGLKDGAADDAPKDNAIFVREWLDYATGRVPQMQLEKLKESRDLREDFSFVEGEARDVAPDKREVQQPRVFYRREVETNPLIVARPK